MNFKTISNVTFISIVFPDFEITTTCVPGIESNLIQYLNQSYETTIETEAAGSYSNDSCTQSGNTYTHTVNLKYPGAFRFFTITFTNTGSITAKINTNSIQVYNEKYCIDGYTGNNANNTANGSIEENTECSNSSSGMPLHVEQAIYYTMKDKNGNFFNEQTDISEYVEEVDTNHIYFYLPPGASLIIIDKSLFNSNYGNALGATTFLASSSSTVTYTFDQKD